MVLENIQNVLNVPEFRKRAVFTLIMFIIFRLGVHIPVPGVDASVIENLFSSGNLFGLLDLFSGGALSKFSVLAMSITPYINASIIMQTARSGIDPLGNGQRTIDGRDKIQKVTRWGTVVLGFIQAFAMSALLQGQQCADRCHGPWFRGFHHPDCRNVLPHVDTWRLGITAGGNARDL